MTAQGTSPRLLLHIDWTACDGRGLCTEILPELLTRDEWGYPLALGYGARVRGAAAPGATAPGSDVPVPDRLADAADEAVALCPRMALTLTRRP